MGFPMKKIEQGTLSAEQWKRVAYIASVSRAMDEVEEKRLLPEKKIFYQFSARGHEVTQAILGVLLDHKHDAASAYYRSRPLLLSLGLPFKDALAAPMGKSGGFSDGRDIGVVCNLPNRDSAIVIPMGGDVGSQFTPAAGWAQAILYHRHTLKDKSYDGAISVVHAGDGAVATNGFWSSLTMATTLKLPMLFFIEDNAYGLSVPSTYQTPGGNIARNLSGFQNLKVIDGDGTKAESSAALIAEAVSATREWKGPVLLRLSVPRLEGHSGQDTQAYKSPEFIEAEWKRDPYPDLERFIVPNFVSVEDFKTLSDNASKEVAAAVEAALETPEPDPTQIQRYLFAETNPVSPPRTEAFGGVPASVKNSLKSTETPSFEPTRINMLTAIRRTMQHELRVNPRVVVFGEDVGPKGGVHGATLGLQDEFGVERVFDTSLSEEGIIGRAVGMAIAGLMPVAEIQFRKYADPATEQLNNCGMVRWRTANRFAAPIVVRIPGGFARCGDPWHSACGEVTWAHASGWRVAFPSNVADAVGLLRSAIRGDDPTIFFEHRNLLDAPSARGPYPGDDFVVPFGKARTVTEGEKITVVSWGAMVERCVAAREKTGIDAHILDLRTISPWDKGAVLESVARTRRCLIVHEDILTAGFGAEIAAVVAEEAFFSLDAPVCRLAVPDVPLPYSPLLMDSVLPNVATISAKMEELLEI
jgi:2-oxoisovalerate dehydrogenase E1 component